MKKVLIGLFLLINVFANATTYYLKTGGSDAADGLSDATAWASISKVNTIAFNAGDLILFKRGDIWFQYIAGVLQYSYLNITHSGSHGSPIIYGAYGTGNDPIFSGMNEVSGWNTAGNWTNTGSNVWRISWVRRNNKERIWIDGIEIKKSQTISVTVGTPFYWASDLLYIYSTSNPATAFTSMECASDVNAFIPTFNSSYITIQNIDIRGFRLGMHLDGCSNFIIENCKIGENFTTYGIVIVRSDQNSSNNITIRNNILDTKCHLIDNWEVANTEDGIIVKDDSHDIYVYRNSFIDWDHCAFYIYASGIIYSITNVKMYHNYISCADIDYGHALGGDIATLAQSSGNEIYNNLIEDQGVQSQLQIPYLKFHGNIFNRCRGITFFGTHVDGHAVSIVSYYGMPQYMEICNNVFANCNGVGIHIRNVGYATEIKYNTIANNIFYNNAGYIGDQYYNPVSYTNTQLYIEDLSTIYDNTFKNNLFYKSGISDLIYYGGSSSNDYFHTIAEFNAENGTKGDIMINNIGGDPLFKGISDFSLSLGSPAIGAGIDMNLLIDYARKLWLTIPSIGAYEYGSVYPRLLRHDLNVIRKGNNIVRR